MTVPALDSIANALDDGWKGYGITSGTDQAARAALADLDELVQAAEAWRADLYQDGPACRRFGVALARVTGEART